MSNVGRLPPNDFRAYDTIVVKKPKYSDRLIFGLGIPGCVLVAIGLLVDRMGLLLRESVGSNILLGLGGLLAGTAWALTMLNAIHRHAKENENDGR
jgi:hypothetical protein